LAERALAERFAHLTGEEPDGDGRLPDLRPLVVEAITDETLDHASKTSDAATATSLDGPRVGTAPRGESVSRLSGVAEIPPST
jgi:hypothetical protein